MLIMVIIGCNSTSHKWLLKVTMVIIVVNSGMVVMVI